MFKARLNLEINECSGRLALLFRDVDLPAPPVCGQSIYLRNPDYMDLDFEQIFFYEDPDGLRLYVNCKNWPECNEGTIDEVLASGWTLEHEGQYTEPHPSKQRKQSDPA